MEELGEILFADFNQDASGFAIGYQNGLSLFNTRPLRQRVECLIPGANVSLIGQIYRHSLLAFVGDSATFPSTRVNLYDQAADQGHGALVSSVDLPEPVASLHLSRYHLVCSTETDVRIHSLTASLEKLASFPTARHSRNGVALTSDMSSITLLAFPPAGTGDWPAPGAITLFHLPGTLPGETVTYPVPQEILSFRAHDSPIRAMAFSQDGSLLATCSERGTLIRIWDLSAIHREIIGLRRPAELAGDQAASSATVAMAAAAAAVAATATPGAPDPVGAASLSSDGAPSTVATLGASSLHLRPKKLLEFRRGSEGAVIQCLRFSPGGDQLLVSSDRGTVHIYNVWSVLVQAPGSAEAPGSAGAAGASSSAAAGAPGAGAAAPGAGGSAGSSSASGLEGLTQDFAFRLSNRTSGLSWIGASYFRSSWSFSWFKAPVLADLPASFQSVRQRLAAAGIGTDSRPRNRGAVICTCAFAGDLRGQMSLLKPTDGDAGMAIGAAGGGLMADLHSSKVAVGTHSDSVIVLTGEGIWAQYTWNLEKGGEAKLEAVLPLTGP
ncbi:hypothetical protein H696_01834 [Fonticula alba]|uniref:Uncharacterized protein n=1 Tax=Fonticula alba TaxID=691883 RepID=A0A058ZBT2_FONAL|nr:hypothetical protein H696_01834 [Fonticula alba]KCV70887.1 hypothetical protein H696_01834 [Fonticula alba]|eukprot:XP_009494010.1 hypothetical protein H696_01834 [Fonticula alba]